MLLRLTRGGRRHTIEGEAEAMKQAMTRTLILAFTLAVAWLALAGCAGRAPARATTSFTVVSELSDPVSRSATVIITVPRALGPTDIKAAAESVIAARREQFARITVKSFVEAADLNGVPLAVSKFDGAAVEHVFNASRPATERIQTH